MLALLAAEEGNGYWLPHDINEVIWGTLAFVIVFGLLIWKAGPAIKTAVAARPARIKDELDSAATARSTAEQGFADVKAALADADKERDRIIAEARETATKVGADIVARAHTEAATIKERGEIEIASARRQAQADLTAEVSRLALGAAEKVVESNLSDSTQQALVESYISQVGAAN
jgi:F-type H+-transporting ATPase subunit b